MSVKVLVVTQDPFQCGQMQSSATGHLKPAVPNGKTGTMKTRTCRNLSRRSRTPDPLSITFAFRPPSRLVMYALK